jgi:hypothetical protein
MIRRDLVTKRVVHRPSALGARSARSSELQLPEIANGPDHNCPPQGPSKRPSPKISRPGPHPFSESISIPNAADLRRRSIREPNCGVRQRDSMLPGGIDHPGRRDGYWGLRAISALPLISIHLRSGHNRGDLNTMNSNSRVHICVACRCCRRISPEHTLLVRTTDW